ncbi:DUF305 domain-containing protein [Pseudonocardia sp. RS11V-5]|uniref:DUF305 domain-containing protein n=1 Tax=Pseudonocardia terrae TaxID=2905831 RepID=UPI001E5B3404|nr:DUF305 domain-containing protein [Pseudonocardia terrae]MCE3553751.1 DUF305 domain-containing protein [Pseudonocardia terrae]
MATDLEPDAVAEPGRREPRWVRPLVVIAAAVALLLIGGAAGMLVGLPGSAATTTPSADSVDVGFAQDMTVHHEQAVEMASWARDHTTDPQVKQLAFDIETTQLQQIGRMQGWLGLWGAPAFPTGRQYMTWMAEPGDSGHGHSMSGMSGTSGAGAARMPGMATDEDLTNLRAAKGAQLDTLFLQLMLRHHLGGTDMLQYAADHAALPEVRNLAAQALTAQTSEADLMRQLLAARGAQPLPQN